MDSTGSDQPKMTSDEILEQDRLNDQKMSEILEEVKKKPFISDLIPIEAYKEQWRENKFFESMGDLSTRFTHIRELRRDGNCFYRSFLWQMWDHFLHNLERIEVKADFDRIYDIIVKSKEQIMAQGVDEIAIDDFWECFRDEFKKIEEESEKSEEDKTAFMKKLFCTDDWGPYMVMFARYLTSLYLKENAILYEQVLMGETMESYANRQVLAIDQEAEQIPIIALTSQLGVQAEIHQVSDNGKIHPTTIPEDPAGQGRFKANLLFIPGHYEALYP